MMTAEEWNDKPTGSNDGRGHQMTNDTELDTLVSNLKTCSEYLHLPPSVQSIKNIRCMEAMDKAVSAITTLRAQLADAQAEVAFMQTCGVIEMMTRNPNINSYVIEWEGRTIRAEAERDAAQAALAAQIEDACAVLDAYSEYDQTLCCNGRECGCQGASVHDVMKHFIRSQPHDSTALDRIRRAEREKALLEAAGITRPDVSRRYCTNDEAFFNEGFAAAVNTILAMIEQENN